MRRLFRKSSSDQPVRTPDSLFTEDTVEAIIGISEGPIGGLEEGPKSFMLDDTALVNGESEANFKNFELNFYPGTDEGQDIVSKLGGFASSTAVNTSLAKDTAVVRTGAALGITALDFRFRINGLYYQSERGVFAQNLKIKVEYKANSASEWSPAWVAAEPATPVYTPGTIGSVVSTVVNQTNYGSNFTFEQDVFVFNQATAPTTGMKIGDWWLESDNDYYPRVWNGTTWAGSATGSIPFRAPQYWTLNGRKVFKSVTAPTKITDGILMLPSTEKINIGDLWAEDTTFNTHIWNGVAWVTAGSYRLTSQTYTDGVINITEKVSSPTVKEIRVFVPAINEPYDMRVTKLSVDTGPTEESETSWVSEVTWESFQEVTNKVYNWPNTAVAHLVASASDQFSSLPTFNGIYLGRIVRVPSNYNPTTRTYTGVWDGTWIQAYTNNTAYIFKDFVENDTYGLSTLYPHYTKDIEIYEWGVWNDTMVDNGQGGVRPRWTYNDYIQEPRPAREMATYIAGAACARYMDDGAGNVSVIIDKDSDPVTVFGTENVVDGLFTYSYTDRQTRPNYVQVSFINPGMNWNEDKRVVKDQSDIDDVGKIPDNFIAVGCTDVAEALARARYRMATGLTEKTMVSFRTNRKGRFLRFWDIFLVADESMGFGISRRILSIDSATTITLKDAVSLESGITYVAKFEGVVDGALGVIERNIISDSGVTYELEFDEDLPEDLPANATFTIEASNSVGYPKPFRVTNIAVDGDDKEIVIVDGIEVNRLKMEFVDGVVDDLDEVEYSNLPANADKPVSNPVITPFITTVGDTAIRSIRASWEREADQLTKEYQIEHLVDDKVVNTFTTRERYVEISDAPKGKHTLIIRAVSLFDGRLSRPARVSVDLTGVARIIPAPSNLALKDEPSPSVFQRKNPTFVFDHADDDPNFSHYHFRTSDGFEIDLGSNTEYTLAYEDIVGRSFSVYVSAVDQFGEASDEVSLAVSNDKIAAAAAPTLVQDGEGILVSYEMPTENDYAGTRIYASQTSGFTPGPTNLVFEGYTNSARFPIAATGNWYVKIAHFDEFDPADVNYSTQATLNVTSLITAPVEELFGTTEAAAASAAAAEAAKTAAELAEDNAAAAQAAAEAAQAAADTSASAAATQAAAALTQATNAATSATTATTQATNAATQATNAATQVTNAATQATNAATSATNAQLVANRLLPDRPETHADFSNSGTGSGTPTTLAAANSGSSVTVANEGVVRQYNGANNVVTRGWMSVGAGRTFSATVRSAVTVDGTANQLFLGFTAYAADGTYLGAVNFAAVDSSHVVADGWQEFTVTTTSAAVLAAFGTAAYIRARVNGGRNSGGSGSGATWQVSVLRLKDITSETAAAASATAANTSASNAATSATAAGTSATAANTSASNAATSASNAATSASNAATSETNAAGSASTATTQAGLAATSANAANTSASNAATSASNAATSETNAAGSASTATTQAGLAASSASAANTSASNAATSASSAATSATNAAGSASTATTQAGLAAGSATAAGGSATAAAGSASTAGTHATNAGNSATSAAASAVSAQSVANRVLPSRVSNPSDFVTASNAGAPDTATPLSAGTTVAATGEGDVRQFTAVQYLFTRGGIQPVTGRTYRLSVRTRATVDGTGNRIRMAFWLFDASWASLGTVGLNTMDANFVVADGWQTFTIETTTTAILAAFANTANIRGWMATGENSGGTSSGSTTQVAFIELKDVTDVVGAAASASAAATSASAAATSATAAGTSASAANTSALNAATSASNAATSASNAATSETNAAGSASTATTQAGLAATSAGAAGTSASNAASSASSAATSATNAAGSASTATTQAGLAAGSATAASGSATAAAGSASSAATSATNAGNSATSAAASSVSAQSVANRLLPDRVSVKADFVGAAGTGAPDSASPLTAGTVVTVSGHGDVLEFNSVNNILTRGVLGVGTGRTFRLSLTAATTVNGTGTYLASWFQIYDSNWTALGTIGVTHDFDATVAEGWRTFSHETTSTAILTAHPTAVYIRARCRVCANSGGTSSGATVQLESLRLQDVTSEAAAAGSASAAATSASAASTSATNAGASASSAATSATNAATSAGNASTSETNASNSATTAAGHASTASTQATNAANSASAAAGSASAASGSASSASTSATNAGNSATSAASSAVTASSASAAANLTAAQLFPSTFDQDGQFFTTTDTGLANTGSSLTGTFTNISGIGRVAERVGFSVIHPKGTLLAVPGVTYEMEVKARVTVDSTVTGGTKETMVANSWRTLNADGTGYGYVTATVVGSYLASKSTARVADGWMVFKVRYTVPASPTFTLIRPRFYYGYDAGGNGNGTWQIAYMRVIDVSAVAAAETQASAAATSASNASTSATNAGNSATSAATSATNAASSFNSTNLAAAQVGPRNFSIPGQWSLDYNTVASSMANVDANPALAVMGTYSGAATVQLKDPGYSLALKPKAWYPVVTGDKIRVQGSVRALTDAAGSCTILLILQGIDAPGGGTFKQNVSYTVDSNLTVADGIVTFDQIMTVPAGGSTWFQPQIQRSTGGAPTVEVLSFLYENVTAKEAAAASASSASTSATNASNSASTAAGSASTASTSATNAATSATNASNSASAASTSASTASTQATNASNSATAAAASAISAQSVANRLIPTRLETSADWTTITGNGDPSAAPSVTMNGTVVNVTNKGNVRRYSGTTGSAATRGWLPVVSGNSYRMILDLQCTSAGASGNITRTNFRVYAADGTYLGAMPSNNISTTSTFGWTRNTVTTTGAAILASYATAAFVRGSYLANETGTFATVEIAALEFGDNTSEVSAAASASAASTSATNASNSASAASTSATLSANYASASGASGLLFNSKFMLPLVSSVPTNWTNWSNGTGTAVARNGNGNVFAFRLAGGAGANAGCQQSAGANGVVQAGKNYYVRATTWLQSGTYNGAGLYVDWRDASNTALTATTISFANTANTNGVTANNHVGFSSWDVKVTAPANAVRATIYFMSHWSSHNGGNSVANSIDWYEVDFIPESYNSAGVNDVRAAVADGTGAYSYYGMKVGAGNRFASIEALASTKTNVSQLKMTADKFTVQTATTDKQVFSVTGDLVAINADLNVGGSISVGAARLKVALETIKKTGADGATITWAGGTDIGSIPEYVLDLSSLAALASGEQYSVSLTGVTSTGATVYAKIITPGSTTSVSQSTDAAGGSGNPDRVMAKSDSADAYDGIYNFRLVGTMRVESTNEGGFYSNDGLVQLSTWFNDGGGWDEGPTIYLYAQDIGIPYISTGSYTGTHSFDVTVPVSWTNPIGAGGTYDFGVTLENTGIGQALNDLYSVTYYKQTASGTRTASPNGETVKITAFPRNA